MIFTSRKKVMGIFVNGPLLKSVGWGSVILITSLDLYLLFNMVYKLIFGPKD